MNMDTKTTFPKDMSSLLVLGCGTGNEAIDLAEKVGPTCQVLAVDPSATLIDLSKQKAQNRHIENIQFQVGDLFSLGQGSEAYDGIAVVYPEGAALTPRHYQLASSHLKIGGILVTPDLVIEANAKEKKAFDDVSFVFNIDQFFTQSSLKDALEDAGFEDVKISLDKPLSQSKFYHLIENRDLLRDPKYLSIGEAAKIVKVAAKKLKYTAQ